MSRTKFRIMRGPNCWDARVNARIVIEKTTPTTVITAAAMAMSDLTGRSGKPNRSQARSSSRRPAFPAHPPSQDSHSQQNPSEQTAKAPSPGHSIDETQTFYDPRAGERLGGSLSRWGSGVRTHPCGSRLTYRLVVAAGALVRPRSCLMVGSASR